MKCANPSGQDAAPVTESPAMLGEVRAKALMAQYGMRVPRGIVVSSGGLDEGFDAEGIGGLTPPLVVKIMSAEIVHKSDGGFVALHLESAEQVRAAIDRMQDAAASLGAAVDGYLVEEMARPGIELVVGGLTDPTFGPMIMFGLGGIFVEVFKDVAFRICPITRFDAEDMIDDLACKPILEGARGGARVDRDLLVDLLLRVGGRDGVLVREVGRVSEMDLNPVIASEDGLIVVDARVALKREAQGD